MDPRLIDWAADTIRMLLKDWHRLNDENKSLKREIAALKGETTMSYSLVTPCNNYPSQTPEGQGDCLKKDTCLDKCKLEEAVCSIHCMGEAHKGGGTITLDCANKQTAITIPL